MCHYVKVRFESKTNGATGGLVFSVSHFKRMGIGEISEFFPISEAPKMKRLVVSPEYPSWDEAFAHEFD